MVEIKDVVKSNRTNRIGVVIAMSGNEIQVDYGTYTVWCSRDYVELIQKASG